MINTFTLLSSRELVSNEYRISPADAPPMLLIIYSQIREWREVGDLFRLHF